MRNKRSFSTKTQNIFFTSDLHLNHGNILKYSRRDKFLSDRDYNELELCQFDWEANPKYKISFESISNMNNALIDNINKIVQKNDILFHLGDFLFAPQNMYKNDALQFRNKINCKNIYQIWGNHDHDEIYNIFSCDENMMEVNIDFQSITLCHYAMLVWNKSHHGAWHLYGHSHSSLENFAEKVLPNRKSIDVGVDNAYKVLGEYRPFSFLEIKKIMDSKSGHDTQDHHRKK